MTEMKENIVNAARELFADKGFHATSIIEIAEVLGISTGTIMYHFSTKEKILQAVLERHNESFLESLLQTVDRSIVPGRAVKNFAEAFFEHVQSNIASWRVFMQMSLGNESESATSLTAFPTFLSILNFMLKKNGLSSASPGVGRPPGRLPLMLFGAAWMLLSKRMDAAELKRELFGLLQETANVQNNTDSSKEGAPRPGKHGNRGRRNGKRLKLVNIEKPAIS